MTFCFVILCMCAFQSPNTVSPHCEPPAPNVDRGEVRDNRHIESQRDNEDEEEEETMSDYDEGI